MLRCGDVLAPIDELTGITLYSQAEVSVVWDRIFGWARGADALPPAPDVPSTANCNRNANFVFGFFYRKCRKNGELPLKNDDFVLKNGQLFSIRGRKSATLAPVAHAELRRQGGYTSWRCS